MKTALAFGDHSLYARYKVSLSVAAVRRIGLLVGNGVKTNPYDDWLTASTKTRRQATARHLRKIHFGFRLDN